MSPNLKTVHAIYDAFGRGDIATLLEQLSPDVRWDEFADLSAQKAGVPWLAAGRGHDDVMRFFSLIAGWKIHDFKVLDIIGDGRQIVAEVTIDASLPATGRSYRDEELHLWTFDDTGKVSRFRHYVDTAKHIRVAGLDLPA